MAMADAVVVVKHASGDWRYALRGADQEVLTAGVIDGDRTWRNVLALASRVEVTGDVPLPDWWRQIMAEVVQRSEGQLQVVEVLHGRAGEARSGSGGDPDA